MLRDTNQQFGQTVLMITHNPEAASIGDRIIHMRGWPGSPSQSKIRSGQQSKFKNLKFAEPGRG